LHSKTGTGQYTNSHGLRIAGCHDKAYRKTHSGV
jgi:hypothetical protein